MLQLHNYQPKNILVTGGAGFIGSNFIRYFLSHYPSSKIINLDKLTYAGSLDNLRNLPNPSQHYFIHGDICDRPLVDKLLVEYDIDTIIHFAAESHVDRSIAGPGAFIQTNILGTFTLLEAARTYWSATRDCDKTRCRFHHISTDEVYGTLQFDEPAFSETTPYDPHSPYSASKASSDHLVNAYATTYKLPTTITNCSNNFGPYQHAEKFIPTVIRSCIQQQPIPIYGNGQNIRDWLFVTDHCKLIDKVLRRGEVNENYNIGGELELDNNQLVKNICNIMDALLPMQKPYHNLISYVTDRPGHDFRYAIDTSKLKQAGLWEAPVPFQQALKNTIEFYLHDTFFSKNSSASAH